MKIEPLKDTVNEGEKKRPWWSLWSLFHDPCSAHSKSLNAQLAARPEVWGVGLWPDEESELIAHKLALSFDLVADVPVPAFIPADCIQVMNALEYEWGLFGYVLQWVESWYGCKIKIEELIDRPEMTFGEFVQLVRERKTCEPQERSVEVPQVPCRLFEVRECHDSE